MNDAKNPRDITTNGKYCNSRAGVFDWRTDVGNSTTAKGQNRRTQGEGRARQGDGSGIEVINSGNYDVYPSSTLMNAIIKFIDQLDIGGRHRKRCVIATTELKHEIRSLSAAAEKAAKCITCSTMQTNRRVTDPDSE